MSRAWKVFVAGVLAGALIPAAVVVARGFNPTQFFGVDRSTHDEVGGQSTNSKDFQPLSGDLNFSSPGAGAIITLSAEMVSGKAQFKFESADFDPQPVPTPINGVKFVAPGSQSYTFFDSDGCDNFQVVWRRVGRAPAEINQAQVIGAGDSSACPP